MMSLVERISEELKEAMRARDEVRVRAIRSIRAEILKKEKEGKGAPSDGEIIQLISKLVRQHNESIEQFKKGGRQDLVDSEQAELEVLTNYLPASLTVEEIEAVVVQVIEQTGATTAKDMGKVMGQVMGKLKSTGKIFDGGVVNQLVKARLP